MHKLCVCLLLTLLVSGCQTAAKEDTGALLGAVVGGVVGNQFGDGRGQVLATFAGAAIGAVAGASIGRTLDGYDHLQAQSALEHNPSGQPSVWINPDTGARVSVTPISTYQTSPGQYCREYQTSVQVGGRSEQGYGTACRQPDGAWKIAP